jgi:very-short-patch-repair endonuclease
VHVVHAQLDPPPREAVIAGHAARQHGVVSRGQLVEAGLARGAIEHRVRMGWLYRMYRGVYAVGHPPLTQEARWMGAVLAYGDDAALSHACAAALWEIRPYNGVWIDVTTASRGGRARRDRIRLHRSSTLSADSVTTHRAIPVTTIARTLLDVAATLTQPSLARTVEQSEIRRLFHLDAIDDTLARNPHHPGARKLTRALELYRHDELTRSDLEAIFRTLCDHHGLPRPLVNHIVEEKEVDFFWPDERVVVETDGRATHFTIAAYERDRARDAHLTTLGYRVLRFTERQVTASPATIADQLRALLPRSASR